MNMGVNVLKPLLASEGNKSVGKACLGTVLGDLHDIGKNLVKMMLESKGIEVIDLGVDVPPEKFIQTAIDEHCQLICCSALLTTTMGVMKDVVEAAKAAGIRDQVTIMVGACYSGFLRPDWCRHLYAGRSLCRRCRSGAMRPLILRRPLPFCRDRRLSR